METPPATRSPDDAAGPYEPHRFLRWFYERFFAHIRVDERWSKVVRDAAGRGVVVYVMRSISFLDFLCLDFLLKRFALPLVRFVNDLGLWILEPFGKGERRLRLRRQIAEEQALSDVLRESFAALLFLRRPPRIGGTPRRGEQLEVDLIRTLIETQRKIDRPILLVPQTFVWTKLPPNKKRTLLDLFFGPSEWPGRIRVFFQFLLNYRNALLRSGKPFDLRSFVEGHQDLTDGQIADKVRYAMLRILERERTLVLGPGKKTPGRIRDELLRSPRVQKHAAAAARSRKKPLAKVLKSARRELRRLCADQNPYMLGLLHRLFDRLWNRVYDGLEVDLAGLDRLREAARDGSLILLPSHKSHIDYLVLSDVLYQHAMSPPLVAAGDNLSFWPLGPILRRAGGFFIRRSFRGRKLYAVLVDAYIRKLLLEGFHVEFFLEGGRSRTGKLLPPKFGLLTMIVDAALALPGRKIHFVPVSIGYERIIEGRSYVDEASGGEKQKENIGQLLKTPEILRSRYGRLYVQFGEILEFDDALSEVVAERREGEPGTRADLRPPERRALIQRIAHRVVYETNRVTVVTPAALLASTLLSHRKRGMAHDALMTRARTMTVTLKRMGARFANSLLDDDGELREGAIVEATRLFIDGKLIARDGAEKDAIYRVPDERRMALEYYKNNVLHFFVPSALISAALVAGGAEPIGVEKLRHRVRQLSRLFKYEFMYRADATFDDIFDDALSEMLQAGELERLADRIQPAEDQAGEMIVFYAEMVRTYFESYRLALRGAVTLIDRTVGRKEWVKKTLATGRRMYLEGEIELHESLSKLRLDNAVQSLKDLGLVRFLEGDLLGAGEEAPDRETLEQLEARLASSLP